MVKYGLKGSEFQIKGLEVLCFILKVQRFRVSIQSILAKLILLSKHEFGNMKRG
jgi:hypothetical protein